MPHTLTPHSYDGIVSALTGNGELCTTLSPTGYHVPLEQATDVAHRTQQFVMAGRRRRGPQHPLVDFGSLWRTLLVDGAPTEVKNWSQEIETASGAVRSRWRHTALSEETRSFVALNRNLFLADTVLTNTDEKAHDVTFRVSYRFGEPDAALRIEEAEEGVAIAYSLEEHLGDLFFGLQSEAGRSVEIEERGAAVVVKARLEPNEALLITTWLHFSDRLHYEFPVRADDIDRVAEEHERAWSEFWSRSEVVTGYETVDSFRAMALYTLRCQATPWSIPPTVSERYWGAGTFHDEMYPFFGLLSSNYPDLAERIPYFRLTTLPQARERARGRGALYPWSSTENGEERDPNGLWLTERFHLGQFAVCIWHLWLTEHDRIQLDDLYPVLRELARYFEMNMLERDADGRLRTMACVDFDESVGAVTNGPFTISSAIASMEYAAHAAEELGRDPERAERWLALAAELRANLPASEDLYAIPDEKPLHYSILGPIFPFRIDVDSPRARKSAAHIHRVCRSTRGWKPGFSEVFEGSSWMWTAGHLGIVHALQGNSDLAWEAVREGPASAGPFLSPNEHRDGQGTVHVPWFTTGCGGWLYALNSLFVQVDEQGTKLLPSVPADLPIARFRDLRGESGVLISGELREGKLVALSARAPTSMVWRFRIPARYGGPNRIAARIMRTNEDWIAAEIELPADECISLIR